MNVEKINNSIASAIPMLNTSVCVYPFGNNHILVECNNHQLKLKKEFQLIFDLINGTNTIENIASQYSSNTNKTISSEFIHHLLFNDLAAYGIIKSDRPVKIRERAIHLRLSFIFWKGRSLDIISRKMSPIFNSSFFFISFLLMILFIAPVVFYFTSNGLNKPFSFHNVAIYATLFFMIVILHELGHVAACYKYGAKHKGIGFGFYLFMPVFFADVSDAWKLSVKERIIVNLGGIYIELIIATFLHAFFLVTKNEILFYSGLVILLHVLFNLNPFLKYDGYWVLSDITGVANLRAQSSQRLQNAFSINKLKQFSLKDYGLLLYAIISYFAIGFALFLLFFQDSQSILHFPAQLFHFFVNINTVDFTTLFPKLMRNSISIIFYIILIRFLFNIFQKYLKLGPFNSAKKTSQIPS